MFLWKLKMAKNKKQKISAAERRALKKEKKSLKDNNETKGLKKEIDGLPIECHSAENSILPSDAIVGENIKISIGSKLIIENGSLKLTKGNRYGLLGPNGSGKSTFLKCLKHRLIPSDSHLNIIEVSQTFEPGDKTVFQTILETNKPLFEIKSEFDKMENQDEEMTEDELKKFNMILEKLDELDYEKNNSIIRKILTGLGFTNEQIDLPTNSFSGGWQRRIELAKVLYLPSDVILLDEPTNHLDLEAVIWLSNYLPTLSSIMVIVSHSSDFLDEVCNQTIFIVNNQFKQFRGNYNQGKYHLDKENDKIEKEYRKLDKKLKDLSKKHTSKKEKEEYIKKQNLPKKIPFYRVKYPKYQCSDVKGELVKIENLNFSYSDKPLLKDINLNLAMGRRFTIVGKNGSGKSTLLKLIAKQILVDEMIIEHNSVLKIGYYHQHFDSLLPPNETPVSYLLPFMSDEMNIAREPTRSIRQFLGQIKLEGKAHLQKIETLSGGQKARVAWLAMILQKPHLIILDEPTNHMDLEGIEGMIESLDIFNGTLLIVTHDPTLITKLDTELLVLENNTITPWKGSYDDYVEMITEM